MLTPKVVPVPEGLASGMYIGSPEGDLGDMPQTTILETIEGAWWVSCSSFVFRLSCRSRPLTGDDLFYNIYSQ